MVDEVECRLGHFECLYVLVRRMRLRPPMGELRLRGVCVLAAALLSLALQLRCGVDATGLPGYWRLAYFKSYDRAPQLKADARIVRHSRQIGAGNMYCDRLEYRCGVAKPGPGANRRPW